MVLDRFVLLGVYAHMLYLLELIERYCREYLLELLPTMSPN